MKCRGASWRGRGDERAEPDEYKEEKEMKREEKARDVTGVTAFVHKEHWLL